MKLMFLTFGLVLVLAIASASAFICIDNEVDNIGVKDFKSKLNIAALENEIEDGLTREGLRIKLKYFSTCK